MKIINILKFIKSQYFTPKRIKVYSHPRSGTHFLEAFIAKNFYQKKTLVIDKVNWGHWSNRKINLEGNPYGKLFGHHHFPKASKNLQPKVYIMRDGRAVAYSVWKTPNFINKEFQGISFQDFLRTKIDWKGTPAIKAIPEFTILEHWYQHVKAWEEYKKYDNQLLLIRYEDLISDPYKVYLKIHDKFFYNKKVKEEMGIDIIKKPIGLLPNEATANSWEKVFSEEDNLLYLDILSKGLNSYKIPD